jgi:flagellar biosynthetic protein FliQ
MEPESAIEASREAIKVCLMVGGPILAVCLIVGLLMGLAQAMSHIQDQALATVPKILAILAVVGLALPWFADRMMEFSKDQFSRPFMADASPTWAAPESDVQSLLANPPSTDDSYYPQLDVPKIRNGSVVRPASFNKSRIGALPSFLAPSNKANEMPPVPKIEESANPFSLPSHRFTRRPSENIEG